METKQQILRAFQQLPNDASVEDTLERLYLLNKIEKGLRQADCGDLISQEEARRLMAKWLNEDGRHRSGLRSTRCRRELCRCWRSTASG